MNRFLKLAVLAFVVAFSLPLSAQVGDAGAPVATFTEQLMCWNNNGNDSTIVRLSLYVVGRTAAGPVSVAYHSLDGFIVLPDNEDLSFGRCDDGAGAAEAVTTDYELLQLCDDGTPFYRVIKIDGADDSSSSLGDYSLAWAGYTASGTVSVGPCNTTTTTSATVFRGITGTSTGGSVDAGKQSVVVHNVGISEMILTVNGSPAKMYPGEHWSFSAFLDPVANVYYRSPAISWGAGTQVVYSYAD